MATNKKPRKKYKPKPMLLDPVGFVRERIAPASEHEDYLASIQLKNSSSMSALTHGRATGYDMDILIAMLNIVQALRDMGYGTEYVDVSTEARSAIINIDRRARVHRKFTPTGPEITALNRLMELHDAQMALLSVQQLDNAIAYAKSEMAKAIAKRAETPYLGSVV